MVFLRKWKTEAIQTCKSAQLLHDIYQGTTSTNDTNTAGLTQWLSMEVFDSEIDFPLRIAPSIVGKGKEN
jgi:hypothetical protein